MMGTRPFGAPANNYISRGLIEIILAGYVNFCHSQHPLAIRSLFLLKVMHTITKTEVETQIRTFLIDNFLFGNAQALSDDSALLGGIVDSTGTIQLVMFLQEKFGITIDDDEIAVPSNFDSVASVVALVENKLRANA